MRARSVVLVSALFLAAAACGTPTDSDGGDGGGACFAADHCVLADGVPTCDDGYTWANPSDPADHTCVEETSCTPTTCADAGRDCGTIADGCGGTLSCGSCPGGETCGGGGTANVCGTGSAGAENTDALCSDGLDNDQDGHTDCDDYDCSRSTSVTVCGRENTDALCSNGLDDDHDGYTDCDDYDCSQNAAVHVCHGSEDTDALCSDGFDDDADGLVDCDDPDCQGPGLTACNGCDPLTCVAAGAACGSIDDGCGGTLDCGGCASGYTCDASHQCEALPAPLTSGGPLGEIGGFPVGAAWPMLGRSPTRQYRADYAGPAAAPAETWTVALDVGSSDPLIASPIVDGDRMAYVAGETGLDAIGNDGTLAWTYRANTTVTAAPAVGLNGTVYVPTADHWSNAFLTAVGPDGVELWSTPTNGTGTLGSPIVSENGTIYSVFGDTLWAVSPGEGTELWRLSGVGSGGLTLGPNGNFLVAGLGKITAVSAGVIVWTASVGMSYETPSAPAILADGSIFVESPHALARLASDGTEIWQIWPNGYFTVPPAIGPEGHIYALSTGLNPTVHAFDSNGTELWSTELPFPDGDPSPPVVDADGNVYVWFGASPTVFVQHLPLVSLAPDGSVRWTKEYLNGSPCPPIVFEDGGLYGVVITGDGSHSLSLLE